MEFDPISYLMGAKAGSGGGGGGVPYTGLQYVMNRSDTSRSRVICTLNSREFYKTHSDPCFAAWIMFDNNTAGPLLVSEIADGAMYGTSVDGKTFAYAGTVTYGKKLYYYSSNQYWLSASSSSAGFASFLGTYAASDAGHAQAAVDLLNLVFGADT